MHILILSNCQSHIQAEAGDKIAEEETGGGRGRMAVGEGGTIEVETLGWTVGTHHNGKKTALSTWHVHRVLVLNGYPIWAVLIRGYGTRPTCPRTVHDGILGGGT